MPKFNPKITTLLLLTFLVTLGLAISLQGVLGINIGSNLDLGNAFKITRVVTPTDPGDVATKGWVESIAGGAGSQFFTSSGTFTVPAGVTSVRVTAVGGGGGGGGGQGASAGSYGGTGVTGGSSCFGTTCISGGGGGGELTCGIISGICGGVGVSPFSGSGTNGQGGEGFILGGQPGIGGHTMFGGYVLRPIPMSESDFVDFTPFDVYGYGAGGRGGGGWRGGSGGGGGGGGGVLLDTAVSVVPGSSVSVTVGSGGSGGASGGGSATPGSSGLSGFVLVEW